MKNKIVKAREEGGYYTLEFADGWTLKLSKWRLLRQFSGSDLLRIRELIGREL